MCNKMMSLEGNMLNMERPLPGPLQRRGSGYAACYLFLHAPHFPSPSLRGERK